MLELYIQKVVQCTNLPGLHLVGKSLLMNMSQVSVVIVLREKKKKWP